MISAWIGSLLFLAVAILYLLLALGLPYGDYVMGGKYKIMTNLNTLMNAFSQSKKERLVMTPLSFVTAICFLLTALNG